MSLKDNIKADVKKVVKNANSLLNQGKIEDARTVLSKIKQFYTSMNNYCREVYKKACVRAGLVLE